MTDYSNAFKEVYEILNSLEEEEYKKISKDLIKVIEENKNDDYEYIVDEEKSLKEQSMLPETKAILFNIFRDYLSTPEQREKIKVMQAEDRRKAEELKREAYYKNRKTEEIVKSLDKTQKVELIKLEEKEGVWKKVKNIISMVFKRT